jgi:glycosyltransferase involved in cell wall biosynthesis
MRGRAGQRPRVLILPSSYFAGSRTVGGGERYALEYARALSRLTPTTLALFDREARVERTDELEIRTFAARTLDERRWLPFGVETARALAAFDVFHLMVFPTPVSDLLSLLASLRRRTLVLTDVGGGIPSASTYLQRLHPRLGLSRLADGLALLSRHSVAQFSDWRQPRTVLYGGAELPDVTTAESMPLGYALYVGRLLPHKGVLPLIEAVSEGTPLRVVGRPYDPEYLERLRAAARGKRVEFILDADDAELRRQYLGASVVLQPSVPVASGVDDTSELLGLVTLEGMAHGKPVIVTRTASLPELVRDGETGFIVPPGDAGALGQRIDQLVFNPELSIEMGGRGRRHVEESFTWPRVAERGLDFYRLLMAP